MGRLVDGWIHATVHVCSGVPSRLQVQPVSTAPPQKPDFTTPGHCGCTSLPCPTAPRQCT